MNATRERADLDVIIVHYHAAQLVRQAVESLKRDAHDSGLVIRIFVADNGSTPDERELLQACDVEHLETGRDAGYAGGLNFAFPATSSDSVVVMNEDIIVLPGCLRSLRDQLIRGAAVCGPEFFWDEDRIFRLPCTEERTRRNELLKVSGKRNLTRLHVARQAWRAHARRFWRSTDPLDTTSLSGALLAFRRDAWMTVGAFDEGFQLYFDENDWLFRIRDAGLRSVYVPRAKAIHLHNPKLADDADRSAWATQSFLRFGNRYYGETFMRRLFAAGSRPAVVPKWEPLSGGKPSIALNASADYAWPLWVELTPSPFGYPAAAACLVEPATRWQFPAMRGLEFLNGTLHLQLVDDAGREIRGFRLQKKAMPVSPVCEPAEDVVV